MAKRRTLTRASVLETAAQLADQARSSDAVTLSALAAALDVRTPSLYNHIANLDDLRQGMAEVALDKLNASLRGAVVGKRGREALRALAIAFRHFALAHPGVYPLTVAAPDPQHAPLVALAEELLHHVLLVLATAGISGDEALHAVRGLRAVMHGYMALETAGGYQMPLDREASYLHVVDTYLNGLLPN